MKTIAKESMDNFLSDENREMYMKELEKMISLPALYHDNVEEWAYIIQDVEPDEFDPEDIEMTKKEYKKYLKEYRIISKNNEELHALNDFMIGANGIGADYDYDDLDDQPIEFFMKSFGVSIEIAIMIKSIHDCKGYTLESSEEEY